MKKTMCWMLIFFFSLVFIIVADAQAPSDQQKSAIEKEIDTVFHNMIKAAENSNYDLLDEGVNDEHKAGFILSGTYFAAFDSLLNNVRSRSQGIVSQVISVLKEKITVLSETIVLLTACGNAKIETFGGNSFNTNFYWSFVFEKIGNDWKVIQSHQSGYR